MNNNEEIDNNYKPRIYDNGFFWFALSVAFILLLTIVNLIK